MFFSGFQLGLNTIDVNQGYTSKWLGAFITSKCIKLWTCSISFLFTFFICIWSSGSFRFGCYCKNHLLNIYQNDGIGGAEPWSTSRFHRRFCSADVLPGYLRPPRLTIGTHP